ncbi:MAG: electron transfer flavoprotein subunit beta/FixA family protein [Desulfobacter sp.]|nr:MAG: electron transfer flavoprotein subunit beta/FixA family protein [Desulfobacter sp.]
MDILVCVKPDMSGQEIGPFEALALEAGLQLRDSGGRVDVVTAGPGEWEDILRRALGMGADRGFHILVPDHDGPGGLVPASVTAGILARALSGPEFQVKYDLILTGVMSQDLMAGQTGPMLAEYLGLSLATAVVGMQIGKDGITAEREWEGGTRERLGLPLPALVSVQAGGYVPRYPSLSNMLRAKSAPIHTIFPDGDAKSVPREIFLDTAVPEKSRAGVRAAGGIHDQVRAFTAFIRERGII